MFMHLRYILNCSLGQHVLLEIYIHLVTKVRNSMNLNKSKYLGTGQRYSQIIEKIVNEI